MTGPANDMERALTAARDGELSDEQLLEALAAGQAWVPLPGGMPGGRSTDIPVMLIDGEKYLPVYTSAEEFSRGAGDMAHMVSPLRELARQLPPEFGIAVNPGGTVGLPIRPAGVDALRGGRWTAAAGSKVRLGQPEVEPAELYSALQHTLAQVPEVKVARSGWAQIGDNVPGVILGIILDPDSGPARTTTLTAIADARGQMPAPPSVDCVFGTAPDDTAAQWLAANGRLLYQRERR